ncbi:hypothetical protein STEG23_005884 [Scotinomys teguina]
MCHPENSERDFQPRIRNLDNHDETMRTVSKDPEHLSQQLPRARNSVESPERYESNRHEVQQEGDMGSGYQRDIVGDQRETSGAVSWSSEMNAEQKARDSRVSMVPGGRCPVHTGQEEVGMESEEEEKEDEEEKEEHSKHVWVYSAELSELRAELRTIGNQAKHTC